MFCKWATSKTWEMSFTKYTAARPHIHGGGIVSSSKKHLRSTVPKSHNLQKVKRPKVHCQHHQNKSSPYSKAQFHYHMMCKCVGTDSVMFIDTEFFKRMPLILMVDRLCLCFVSAQAHLVGVALHRDCERTTQAKIGNLENVLLLVH